ncbi:non-homologous end-joining DNA ligase [Chthonobacter rhizosphaerae]|uniref:non-homologous end-joining DNA ligase n=1 Tax=Chthonobacter rhizosphaerae TaxID=2735553 RepID=UPI0015EEEF08|nr:non-homologous end-joining DNA ligase [Chthonobacter rhizosphaerae]
MAPSPRVEPATAKGGDSLAAYRAKRDFSRTAEPADGGTVGKGLFVVQHHWARREHFDFRLELDGVLVSFAVAKGPSLDPSVRRLAVRTEDHPLSYADFEGTIPKGEYGGGTVMVWDRGVWAPMADDPAAALQKGELKFVLLGERMQGAWVLVRMNVEKGRENWLLIKEKDPYVDRVGDDLPTRHHTSILTGRTREEIEAEETPHSFAADRAAEAAKAEAPPPTTRPHRAKAAGPKTATKPATSNKAPSDVGDDALSDDGTSGRTTDKKSAKTSKSKPAPTRRTSSSATAEAPILAARITHPERVVFPEAGYTKKDVTEYYVAVADRIMRHLDGRPVSFLRAPEGLAGETFFQRHPLPGMKKGVARTPDPQGRHDDYLVVESAEGLVTAAQFGVIEFHGWNARLPDLNAPDRMVFDFDPDEDLGFSAVKEAAFAIREVLKAVDLKSYVLASGGKGLHVVVPLDRTQTLDDIGDFSGGVAKGLARAEPKRYVAVASKARRSGRIFIDWLRNRPYSTAIVPWSLRARANASAAVPLGWDEVEKLKAANQFDLKAAIARPDPWDDFFAVRQRIDAEALKFLKSLSSR